MLPSAPNRSQAGSEEVQHGGAAGDNQAGGEEGGDHGGGRGGCAGDLARHRRLVPRAKGADLCYFELLAFGFYSKLPNKIDYS